MENNELKHWGVMGMKWGVRRYQNKDGSLTTAGKNRYGSGDSSGGTTKKKVSRKVRKQREENLAKARQARTDKKTYEEEKQKAIKSGSAADVLKFKGDLTPQEMQSALSRIRWEQDMASISNKDIASGKSKVDEMMDKIGKTTSNAVTVAKAYNMVANVVNAFNPYGKLMPKIDTNIDSGNRSQMKQEAKERKKKVEAEAKRADQEAQKETKQKERAEKKAKTANNTTEKINLADYITDDNPRSTNTNENKSTSKNTSTIIDLTPDEFRETTMSNVPSTQVARGRRIVAGLLEDERKR